LPCWIYGELYKARNDFLHGNRITAERLTVRPSNRSLYIYAAPLYRLALTGFLNLRFDRPIPSQDDTAAFAAYINDRMDFRFPSPISRPLHPPFFTRKSSTALGHVVKLSTWTTSHYRQQTLRIAASVASEAVGYIPQPRGGKRHKAELFVVR
jgi:hypothetical protein